MRFTLLTFLIAAAGVSAETEIHRCTLADGTIAFQETPCPEPAVDANDGSDVAASNESGTATADDSVMDFVNPFDEPQEPEPAVEPPLPEPVSQDRAECEKMTRDAIDAIDLEMRQNAYTREEGQQYLAELRLLTQQLRACKRL